MQKGNDRWIPSGSNSSHDPTGRQTDNGRPVVAIAQNRNNYPKYENYEIHLLYCSSNKKNMLKYEKIIY
jgi:hypothetical protein